MYTILIVLIIVGIVIVLLDNSKKKKENKDFDFVKDELKKLKSGKRF